MGCSNCCKDRVHAPPLKHQHGGNDLNIHGIKYDDYLYGPYGCNVIRGRSGDDIIEEYIADLPVGSRPASDNDQFFGGKGDDRLISFYGRDQLFADSGMTISIFILWVEQPRDSSTGGSGSDSADLWVGSRFEILLEHHDENGVLAHMMVLAFGDVIDIQNVEEVEFHWREI